MANLTPLNPGDLTNDLGLKVAKEYVEFMAKQPQDEYKIRCANSDCTHVIIGNGKNREASIRMLRDSWHGAAVPGFRGLNGTTEAVVCSDCYSLFKDRGLIFKDGLVCNAPPAEWTVNVPAVLLFKVRATTLAEAQRLAWAEAYTKFPSDKNKNQGVYPQWYDSAAQWYFSAADEDSDMPF